MFSDIGGVGGGVPVRLESGRKMTEEIKIEDEEGRSS